MSDAVNSNQGESVVKIMTRNSILGFAAAALGACGGGGGGGADVASIPPAPLAPPPPPPAPSGPPPLPTGPIGSQVSGSFATQAVQFDAGKNPVSIDSGVQFSYSATDNKYTISLPGFQPGQLVTTGASGSYANGAWTDIISTQNDVTTGGNSTTQAVSVTLRWPGSTGLKYTGSGTWWAKDLSYWAPDGIFAYGSITPAGGVPTTGSASYTGEIVGLASGELEVWGNVALNFNFAGGTLSGQMKPEIAPVWDIIPLGAYTFRDTVYSSGSRSFSGAFQVNGSTEASSFQGSFTGPQAEELMASWNAPFLNPETKQWGTMVGIWTAKRP